MASEFKRSLRSLHGSFSGALQLWRYHHSRPDGHRIENDLRKTPGMIKRDRRRPHLGKRTVQSSHLAKHTQWEGRFVKSKRVKAGGGFCQRKEDEVTLEDPVQEESDSKSESHVIEAFLTDGHNTKPLSCGKHLARMALWMLSFSKSCLIPLSETYMMLVWAMHCAVLLEGLRTTATLIVFLLCSHNSFSDSPNSASLVVAFLCRNSVSPLVRSYHLSSCFKQPSLISTNLFDHFSSFCHSSHNTICASW